MTTLTCPCHSELPYFDCCQPFHTGTHLPSTALKLMRSRYCAYSLRFVDYLVDTTHPDKLKTDLRKNLLKSVNQLTWTNLIILKTNSGDTDDKTGKVSFEATYIENTKEYKMLENSRFRKRNGK